jgi:hypothetical protein
MNPLKVNKVTIRELDEWFADDVTLGDSNRVDAHNEGRSDVTPCGMGSSSSCCT